MMATSAEGTPAKVNGSTAPLNGKMDDQQLLERGDAEASNGVESPHRRAVRSGFSAKPTLEDIRRLQAEFTDERDWSKFHQPRSLLLAMVGEVGEVSELFQWRGEVAPGLPGWSDSERQHLAQELSDVLIYLVELSDVCGVDLPQAVLQKMALNRKKYPASKVHGSAKKYNEYED
ncbi:glutamyl-tRNA(Gln) amidotransferase subunit B, mitochondrial [Synchiropus splendidus]|uniref:glutamyl-tRNA(Gln) amidotransferase subunit B, mitochondrial n=1 Tax=Synchiropus splendidus TaxID=270530 RepID=UPI00237D8AE5|nr:glutamyl-tRNA(Gln) amidotransferase subunit B, mitochondrial [Synchiropus splendidus]